MSSDKQILAVEPQVKRFAAYGDQPGLESLLELLQAQRDTEPVPIHSHHDVLLNHEGMIQEHFRLTTTALQHLCSILAPGLTDVVRNIGGLRARRKQYAHEQYSFAKAVELLNWMIKFRFNLLEGASFVMDRRSKQIEGIVGQKYRFLSNLEMFSRVDEFLRVRAGSVRFWEAALAGRRLLLRYRATEKAFTLATPHQQREPFYTGIHFSNSELGDCCVKGSVVLYRQWSKTAAMMPFTDETRLVHFQGEKFNNRLTGILETVRELIPEIGALSSQARRLQSLGLGLGGTPEDHKARLGEILTLMTKGGITRKVATDAIHRALVHGSYKTETIAVGRDQAVIEMLSPDILRRFSHRTVYDVFNGLCYLARKQQPARQEALEQRAFDVLNNNINIV